MGRIAMLFSILLVLGCNKNESEMTGGQGPKVRDLPKEAPGTSDPSPRTDPPQAVGFYANGRIINDLSFPLEGKGYLKVFRSRNRHFGTYLLHDVVAYGAEIVSTKYKDSERLQIGDISKIKGGQLSRHASHQNGLDMDIAYYRVNRREMNPEGFGGFDENFVSNGRVTANFDLERNWELMKAFVSTGYVGRIFVDAAIKNRYCSLARGRQLTRLEVETLRRMRPLALHGDHLHLRVKCPLTSPDCVTQVEPPIGTGCPAEGKVLVNEFDPFEIEY